MEDDIVKDTVTISNCDKMSPDDFEMLVKEVYEKIGYENVIRTQHSGDHGADIVMENSSGEKTVVQTKRWKAKITNDSVQEVLGAMSWYDAKNGIVVGTAGFTKFAQQEAKKSGIELVDRFMLEKLLEDYPTSRQNWTRISDIRIEDIYKKYPDYEEICKKMVRRILVDHDDGGGNGWLIQEIEKKLILELLSPDDQRRCLEKILELLKVGYSIDLEKEREVERRNMIEDQRKTEFEKQRQQQEAQAAAEATKQRYAEAVKLGDKRREAIEKQRIKDENEAKIVVDKKAYKKVDPIMMSPEKADMYKIFLTELTHLEKEYYDGVNGPIPVDVLFANLKRKNPEFVKEFAGIMKMLIKNSKIIQSRAGYLRSNY